jgi:hypothetical protein
LSGNSEIEEAQCECAAGMGPSVHCKHICTVLYAAHVFCKTGSVLVENMCTEKLQSFHHVKKNIKDHLVRCVIYKWMELMKELKIALKLLF